MLAGLAGFESVGAAYHSAGIVRVMGSPLLVGDEGLMLIGWSATALALAIVLFLPNVPQVFRYREYRRKPEEPSFICWRPNLVWALLSA